jgi:hypothetical protein
MISLLLCGVNIDRSYFICQRLIWPSVLIKNGTRLWLPNSSKGVEACVVATTGFNGILNVNLNL